MKPFLTTALLSGFFLTFTSCDTPKEVLEQQTSLNLVSKRPTKVAYIGDSDHEESFKRVLQLIKDENADLVIHLGDLAYDEENPKAPKEWNNQINEVLGERYPYLFLIGNHDRDHWFQKNPVGYATLLEDRISKNSELKCTGEPGIKSYCTYRGLFFALSGIGTYGEHHEDFLAHSLRSAKDYKWRICAWHKNQRDMQPGGKTDEVGWNAYKLCQHHGAMIATGHEHSYSRTKNLRDIGNQNKEHGQFGSSKDLELAQGQTFVFVNGLGGAKVRDANCELAENAWWASILADNYHMDNGVVKYNGCEDEELKKRKLSKIHSIHGVLFVSYNYQDDPKLAHAEFKTVDGTVMDEFTIRTKN